MVGPRREDFRMVALTALAGAVLRLPKHDPMVQFRLQRKALLARPVWTCLDSGQVDLWSDSRWYVDDPDTVRKLIEDASCRYCNGLLEYFRPPVRGEIGGLVACGVPFREAHEVVGKVLRATEQEGKSIREMPIERLKEFSPAFGRDLSTVLTLESALGRRAVAGGTAPAAVRAALGNFKARLEKIEEGQ